MSYSRRRFLVNVGQGMMVAGVGSVIANELGLFPVFGSQKHGSEELDSEESERLSFGALEPYASMLQETPVDRLLPALVDKLKHGTDLRTLIAAGALANARTFGGQNYIGYHAFMALMPAYRMSQQMPARTRALPVLKVLYRNTAQMQSHGGRANEVLRPIRPIVLPKGLDGGGALFATMLERDMDGADRTFATIAKGTPEDSYRELQRIVQDEVDVHRVVLAWRAWDLLSLTGREHAHTMLRQSVRFCVEREQRRVQRDRPEPPIRSLLPKLMEQHGFGKRKPGESQPDDAWVEEFAQTVCDGTRVDAAAAAARALDDGIAPEAVGEAMSLAATGLLLRDPGRRSGAKGKPRGSVHGASVGVHAADSANAWRNIARVSSARDVFAGLIVGAYHTAGQSGRVRDEPFPFAPELEELATDEVVEPAALLAALDQAVEASNQARAIAVVARYGQLGHRSAPVFEHLLKYAVSEDGALHAEKYYRTVVQEFATTRPAFRWRHLQALARVTASEFGHPAPGYAEARRLLGV